MQNGVELLLSGNQILEIIEFVHVVYENSTSYDDTVFICQQV